MLVHLFFSPNLFCSPTLGRGLFSICTGRYVLPYGPVGLERRALTKVCWPPKGHRFFGPFCSKLWFGHLAFSFAAFGFENLEKLHVSIYAPPCFFCGSFFPCHFGPDVAKCVLHPFSPLLIGPWTWTFGPLFAAAVSSLCPSMGVQCCCCAPRLLPAAVRSSPHTLHMQRAMTLCCFRAAGMLGVGVRGCGAEGGWGPPIAGELRQQRGVGARVWVGPRWVWTDLVAPHDFGLGAARKAGLPGPRAVRWWVCVCVHVALLSCAARTHTFWICLGVCRLKGDVRLAVFDLVQLYLLYSIVLRCVCVCVMSRCSSALFAPRPATRALGLACSPP